MDDKEKQAIALVLDGHIDQFQSIVERYHKGLIRHIYTMVQDEALAEDIAQESFIQAYQKLYQYKAEYAFSTWLYKIGTNIAYRYIKKDKHHLDISEYVDMIPDDKQTSDERLDNETLYEYVRSAVETLEPHYKQVISMYYWDNMSYEQIASAIDKPIGTIRTWLYRSKDQLRKELYEKLG